MTRVKPALKFVPGHSGILRISLQINLFYKGFKLFRVIAD